jgi:hypothetical protein
MPLVLLSIVMGAMLFALIFGYFQNQRLKKELKEMTSEVLGHLELLESKEKIPLPTRLAAMRERIHSGRYK